MSGDFRDDPREDDPRTPVFFLSYARARQANAPVSAPYQVNKFVLRLFRDLTAQVNELIALPPGRDPGFMDMTMEGGELWEKRLLHAAGTCQVFICLLSPPFLARSQWCAMEWDIFSRRKLVRRSDGQPGDETGILPVLWVPIQQQIPPMVNAVTRFAPRNLPDPNFGPQFETDGLFGLLKTHQVNAYDNVVWRLALQVQRLHATYWVEPGVPSSTDGLQRSFPKGAV